MAAVARPRRASRRRTQAERREETQAAVLDATVQCLAELGYARTTTTRIARRARVSRGALLHYYSSKAELLASAVEHIFQRRTAEFREAFGRLPPGERRGARAVDILWEIFSGPTFHAWLELLVASRNDRTLHAHVSRIAERFGDTVLATYRQLFPATAGTNAFYEIAPGFAFAFLQGLALDRIVAADDTRVEGLLDGLKALEPLMMSAPLQHREVRA